MDNRICLPVLHFTLLIFLALGGLVWTLLNFMNNPLSSLNNISSNSLPPTQPPSPPPPPPPPPPTEGQLDAIDSLATGELPPRRRDYRRLDDPLKEPRRRYTTGGYGARPWGNVNIDTRGYLEPYHLVGYLNRMSGGKKAQAGDGRAIDSDRMLKLFGRRTDKYEYEYYVIHHNDPELKIPLDIRGDRELMDKSEINVPGYAGKYRVNLYEIEAPKYIPY